MATFLSDSRASKQTARVLTACTMGMLALQPNPVKAQCDPQELPKLLASDAAVGDYFGYSAALAGDTAVAGAYLDDHAGGVNAGSAYVFTRSAGAWSQQGKLIGSDTAANDQFGESVAVSGDTVVVGAFLDDLPGKTDAGSAYVFTRAGNVWTQQAKLIASDSAAGDVFGFSVAIAGDTIVVGAYADTNAGGMNAGSAYVFVRSGTVWTQQQKLTAADASAQSGLGFSVAISGESALMGAIDKAYVFVRSGTIWTQQQKLTPSDLASGDYFGIGVALSGDTAVIGSGYDNNEGGSFVGSAYVFTRGGTLWTQRAKLRASNPSMNANFGSSVSLEGDRVVVGAPNATSALVTFAGAVYLFEKPAGGWSNMTETLRILASDAAVTDQFSTVALSGNTVLVGARADSNAGGSNAGAAYPFDLACDTDTDSDGVLDADDVCPDNAPGLPIDCDGRPLRDANNDCQVNVDDVTIMVNELLSLTVLPNGCEGQPLRDTNGDLIVDGADLQIIVDEMFTP